VIHPLADDRRILSLERKGELLHAAPGFQLAMSFNPQQQHALKQLKPSTRQRFVTLTFNYPEPKVEATIVVAETGVDRKTADKLVSLATKVRRLRDEGLGEGPGTRTLVSTAKLVVAGTTPRSAARSAMAEPLTEDPELLGAIDELIDSEL
jgi:nitric oxide reductase NorQ protein